MYVEYKTLQRKVGFGAVDWIRKVQDSTIAKNMIIFLLCKCGNILITLQNILFLNASIYKTNFCQLIRV
jgi:hypothetical protein